MTTRHAIPVTFLIPVFNEERRIRQVLDHAVRWADEILVADKSSTDGTRAICREYGDRVTVLDLPFSPKGHDDFVSLVGRASHDWIFVGTASEVPTRRLVERCRKILEDTGGTLDLVYVPRRMYSFGIHSPRSPWSVSYYAFLFNRRKAVVRNVIHDNFTPANPLNIARVEYAEDCCVHHFTHPSAAAYVRDMSQYFPAEADGTPNDAIERRLAECLRHAKDFDPAREDVNGDLFGLHCAWTLYWMGTALFLWEKGRGGDAAGAYAKMGAEILDREWLGMRGPAAGTPEPAGGPPGPLRILLAKAGLLAGMAAGTARRIMGGKDR